MTDDLFKIDRRGFLKIGAVGGAALGASGCQGIIDDLIPQPFPRPLAGPENRVATACAACPAGCGISVRVVGSNAVSVAGMDEHAISDGGVCPHSLAQVQNLYHPDRLKEPQQRASASGSFESAQWDAALGALAERLGGGSVVFGVGRVTPLEWDLLSRLADRVHASVVRVGLPVGELPYDAMREMLGDAHQLYDLKRAHYVLSLGADWLQTHPSRVEAQRAFADIHRAHPRGRVVTVGPQLTMTALKSDAWVPVASEDMPLFAMALAHQILTNDAFDLDAPPVDFEAFKELASAERFAADAVAAHLGLRVEFIEEVASDLVAYSRPLVVTDRCDPMTQRVGMALNLLLGAVGREGGVIAAKPFAFSVPDLPDEMAFPASARDAAVLLFRANPAFVAPSTLGWSEGIANASFVCSMTSFLDESAQAAHMALPLATPIESQQLTWAPAMDGRSVVTVGPAAVEPLYESRAAGDVLLSLAGQLHMDLPWSDLASYVTARAEECGASDLVDWGGSQVYESPEPEVVVVPEQGVEGGEGQPEGGENQPENQPAIEEDAVAVAAPQVAPEAPQPAAALFHADALGGVGSGEGPPEGGDFPLTLHLEVPMAYAGGWGAHLPYLHGLSTPAVREFWSTTAVLNPETAREAHLSDNQPVTIESAAGQIDAVTAVREGMRPGVVGVTSGLGRSGLGLWAHGQGSNPLSLITESDGGGVNWVATRVRIRRAG